MTRDAHATITTDQLARKLETTAPSNEHSRDGFALVNVLGAEDFERERIPGSVNIPAEKIETVEKRFDKGKEIILYSASPTCEASRRVARELTRRGYGRVVDYEGGMSHWRDGDQPVAGRAA